MSSLENPLRGSAGNPLRGAENELWFTALGPSGAGKTTLLACMNKEFDEVLPGSFFPADARTFSALSQAYKKLEAEANGPELEFGVSIEGTEDLRQYAFTIKGRKESVPVRFFDFPGGWMDPHSGAENYDQVIEIARRSMVILVAINTPYLMEYDGRYGDRAGVAEIEQVLKTSLRDDDTDKLILLVPIKCERYTRSKEENRRMHDKIKEVFAGTLGLPQNPVYGGRLALALLPVHTVGNAQFSRFEMTNGRIVREVYLKNRSSRFSPRDADQPLRFAMSFLLNEFAKGRSSLLHDIFSQDDLREVGSFIRAGMKADDPNFEIFCGRNLIEEGGASRRTRSAAPQTAERRTMPSAMPSFEPEHESRWAANGPVPAESVENAPGFGGAGFDEDEIEDPSFLPSSAPAPKPRTMRHRAVPSASSRSRLQTFQAPVSSEGNAPRVPSSRSSTRRWGLLLPGALVLAAAVLCGLFLNLQGWTRWALAGAGTVGALLFLVGLLRGRRRELTPEELMARDYKRALDWKRDQDWKWLKSVRAFDNLADIFESFGRYRDAAFLAQECRASARALRVRQRSSLCALIVLVLGGAAVYALAMHLDKVPERILEVLDAYQVPHLWLVAAGAALVSLIALGFWHRGGVRARAIRRGDEDEV